MKIIHSMESNEDRELVCKAMVLSDFQALKTQEFHPDECLFGIGGLYGTQYVKVKALEKHPVKNASCHICASRFRCMKENVQRMISGIEQDKYHYHLAKVQNNPYNVPQLAFEINLKGAHAHGY